MTNYKIFEKDKQTRTVSKEALMSWLYAQIHNNKVINITVERSQPDGVTIIKRKGG